MGLTVVVIVHTARRGRRTPLCMISRLRRKRVRVGFGEAAVEGRNDVRDWIGEIGRGRLRWRIGRGRGGFGRWGASGVW